MRRFPFRSARARRDVVTPPSVLMPAAVAAAAAIAASAVPAAGRCHPVRPAPHLSARVGPRLGRRGRRLRLRLRHRLRRVPRLWRLMRSSVQRARGGLDDHRVPGTRAVQPRLRLLRRVLHRQGQRRPRRRQRMHLLAHLRSRQHLAAVAVLRLRGDPLRRHMHPLWLRQALRLHHRLRRLQGLWLRQLLRAAVPQRRRLRRRRLEGRCLPHAAGLQRRSQMMRRERRGCGGHGLRVPGLRSHARPRLRRQLCRCMHAWRFERLWHRLQDRLGLAWAGIAHDRQQRIDVWEILRCLVRIGERLQRRHGLGGRRCRDRKRWSR